MTALMAFVPAKHLYSKPTPAKIGLAVALLAVTVISALPAGAQDQVIQTYGTGTPTNSWAYSKDVGVGHPDTNYYPDSADISRATFQGYVSTPANAVWGGSQFYGDDTTFVFDTNVTSNIDRTLSLSVSGDDGHSAFVNGQLVGGGAFGVVVNFALTLKAGVPVNLEVADHNAAGPWDLTLQDQLGDPFTSVSGITLDAAPVPEASTLASSGLLLGLGLSVIAAGRRKEAPGP